MDGTFGRGGHSALILEQLGSAGKLIALDRDPAAVAVGSEWRDARFQMVHSAFAQLTEVLSARAIEKVGRDKEWIPKMDAKVREGLYSGWKKAVTRTFGWVE